MGRGPGNHGGPAKPSATLTHLGGQRGVWLIVE